MSKSAVFERPLSFSRARVRSLQPTHSCPIPHFIFLSVFLIFLKKGQRLVIADFGLAKKAETRLDNTRSTLSTGGSGHSQGGMVSQGAKSMYATQVGTLMYMAPELIEKRKFCRGSDMWAFGVILWELLTGCLPYSYELENDGIAIAYRVGYTGYKLKVDDDWSVIYIHSPASSPHCARENTVDG